MKKALFVVGGVLLGLLLYAMAQPHASAQVQPGPWTTSHPTVVSFSANHPYVVTGKPTISASFINRVLSASHSSAQGKG